MVAGVDGCRGGWVVVTVAVDCADDTPAPECVVVPDLTAIVEHVRDGSLAAVGLDMPIGLAADGRRQAAREARTRLGRRRSSLFPTPPFAVLGSTDYAGAVERCR